MQAILFVRIETELDADAVGQRIEERRPLFADVPGLIRKEFGRDPQSGSVCGIYFFESEAALAAYRDSELAASIPAAYAASDVRREVYQLL